MNKVTPFLFFDGNAEEAVEFYVSVFRNSKITNGRAMMQMYKIDIATLERAHQGN